ncbi:MAG: response regulator [Sulfitobacter sp.]
MTETEAAPIGTLMLIDDSEIDQMIYRRIATKSGLVGTLVQFTDATLALDYLADKDKTQPDLILLDINMPRMDGFEFLEAAMERFGVDLCPIIVMLTTSLNPKDEERAKSIAIVRDFLNKPLTRDQLAALSKFVAGHPQRKTG